MLIPEKMMRHDRDCRLCGSSRVTSVMRLCDTPLEDQFVTESNLGIEQPVFPLELAICENCGYVHLPHIVSPEASYSDYVYVSGVTVGLRPHFDGYAIELVGDFGVPQGALAVDLGSNDGSMLDSFKRLGMRVLGVEPARQIALKANEAGLSTINDFFTSDVAAKIVQLHGSANIVTANYMYANIDDVREFTMNVAKLLSPDGIFAVQTGYHPEQMRIKMFDYIYHEHFSYFTVEVLKQLFESCGLELIQAQKTSPKGGSIRVIGQLKAGKRQLDGSVQRIVMEERKQGMCDPETYREFSAVIAASRDRTLELLEGIKAEGKRVVGFGASHSTTTLIYHFGLGPYIEYLVDDNPLKHGRYSPGYHIPVFSSQKLYEDLPDYAIILGWQHQKSIMERHAKYLMTNGHWIVPLPQLQIL
jgi:hypothetical protein